MRNVYVICKQRAANQGNEPREGGMDDDHDHGDRIYAVYSV